MSRASDPELRRPRRARLGVALAVAWACAGDAQAARAQAGGGAYAPVDVHLLLRDRPAEGLLVLHSGYANSELVDADAVVFMGATDHSLDGDVLTVSIRVREPHGFGHARVGRFILATGAVRPVHLDGASVLGRLPTGTSLEVFGGLPVVPAFGPRAFDWLVGSRLGQWLADERFGIGVSYLQRRDAGALDDEEIGVDVTVAAADWLTLNGVAAWDLVYAGLAEMRASASATSDGVFVQVLAAHRVAALLLPATSLFSVISDAPSNELGADATVRLFPRLDVGGGASLDGLDDDWGYRFIARGTLYFADPGVDEGQLTAEATRRRLAGEGWTGAALSSRVPIGRFVQASASLELAAPDHARGRGALWPWSRAGASYALSPHWSVAAALGAKASPEAEHEIQGLVRVSYTEAIRP